MTCHYVTSAFLLWACAVSCLDGGDIDFRNCGQIYVGGSHIQPQVTGTYHLQKYTYRNRLVFKHACADLVLHYDGTKWVIGDTEGSTFHYVMSGVTSSAVYPRDVTSWSAWDADNGTWLWDARLFVVCTDLIPSCSAFLIVGPDVPESHAGPYDVYGNHDNHTAYKHRHDDLYVYRHNDTTCARWVVGPDLGSDVVAMQTISDRMSPFGVTGSWVIVHGPERLQRTYAVKLECVADSASVACGPRPKRRPVVQAMLLGGTNTYPGKWPFMVSFQRADGVHKCGGALVNSRWVVTAGHCVSGADVTNETILVGAYNLENNETTRETMGIKAAYLHPEFIWVVSPFRLDNDIALVELSGDVTLSDWVQPACIPAQSEVFPYDSTDPRERVSSDDTYTSCHMTGWGRMDRAGDVGGSLLELGVLEFLPMNVCYSTYYSSLGRWMEGSRGVCLLGENHGRMCKGDSGSPVFCERAGQWSVLGVGGWSLADCARYFYNFPSVYTDLSHFADWIRATIHGYGT